MKKLLSAFVSSVFQGLEDDRKEVIDCLLDHSIFPISMEHFTVSTSNNFGDIKEKIDLSDMVILILGKEYGCINPKDEQKRSFTEMEFDYAKSQGKKIVSMVKLELIMLEATSDTELTDGQKKQLEFYRNKANMSVFVKDHTDIYRAVSQAVSGLSADGNMPGWTRNIEGNEISLRLEEWKKNNTLYNLSGEWHHVHFSDEDKKYLRIGTVKILQNFTPEDYLKLNVSGKNYSIKDDLETKEIEYDRTRFTKWNSEYRITDNGELEGIFNSSRAFNSKFANDVISTGSNRGVHELSIEPDANGKPVKLTGTFYNLAPSDKFGNIILFRRKEDRDKFVVERIKMSYES